MLKNKITEEQGNTGLDSDNYDVFLASCDKIGVPSTSLRPKWIIPSTIANESLTLGGMEKHSAWHGLPHTKDEVLIKLSSVNSALDPMMFSNPVYI